MESNYQNFNINQTNPVLNEENNSSKLDKKENLKNNAVDEVGEKILNKSQSNLETKKLEGHVVTQQVNQPQIEIGNLKITVHEQEKEKIITEKNCGWCNCIGRELDESSGGYFYIFEEKKEYKNLNDDESVRVRYNMNKTLYPAIQLPPEWIIQSIKRESIFQKLGYQVKNNCIIFPDEKILMARWSALQKKSNLPDLSFISSEGVADDKSFIKNSLEGHILLSTGPEFLHDQEIHIMSRIHLCSTLEVWSEEEEEEVEEYNYDSVMNKYQNKMNRISDSIEKLEKGISIAGMPEIEESNKEAMVSFLWTYLGGMVDYAGTENSLDDLYNHYLLNDIALLTIGENTEWENYMHKRFGDVFDENKAKVDLAWQKIILSLNA